MYRLKAFIGDRMISHDFEVKKYGKFFFFFLMICNVGWEGME